jgi:hypothetical protein
MGKYIELPNHTIYLAPSDILLVGFYHVYGMLNYGVYLYMCHGKHMVGIERDR